MFQRLSEQRKWLKERDLNLIAQYGTETPEGLILTRKDIAEAEREEKRLVNRLSRLQDIFIATDGDTMITAYRATRRQRRLQLGNW